MSLEPDRPLAAGYISETFACVGNFFGVRRLFFALQAIKPSVLFS
jgi:hypothetical protein